VGTNVIQSKSSVPYPAYQHRRLLSGGRPQLGCDIHERLESEESARTERLVHIQAITTVSNIFSTSGLYHLIYSVYSSCCLQQRMRSIPSRVSCGTGLQREP
jgi:hypothetical protein